VPIYARNLEEAGRKGVLLAFLILDDTHKFWGRTGWTTLKPRDGGQTVSFSLVYPPFSDMAHVKALAIHCTLAASARGAAWAKRWQTDLHFYAALYRHNGKSDDWDGQGDNINARPIWCGIADRTY